MEEFAHVDGVFGAFEFADSAAWAMFLFNVNFYFKPFLFLFGLVSKTFPSAVIHPILINPKGQAFSHSSHFMGHLLVST
jgi:hypothetical protein